MDFLENEFAEKLAELSNTGTLAGLDDDDSDLVMGIMLVCLSAHNAYIQHRINKLARQDAMNTKLGTVDPKMP